METPITGGRLLTELSTEMSAVQRDDRVAAVERVTRRRVIAFVSSVHFDPDMAFEVFLLEPLAAPAQDGVASLKTSTE